MEKILNNLVLMSANNLEEIEQNYISDYDGPKENPFDDDSFYDKLANAFYDQDIEFIHKVLEILDNPEVSDDFDDKVLNYLIDGEYDSESDNHELRFNTLLNGIKSELNK